MNLNVIETDTDVSVINDEGLDDMYFQATMLSVDRAIRLHACNTPDAPAVADPRTALSYAQLDERIDRVLDVLASLGLQRGERLAVLMRNRVEWAEVLLGCARAGVVCVPVNSRFMDAEIAYVLKHSRSRALLCDAALLPRIGPLRPDLLAMGVNRVVVLGDAPERAVGDLDYGALMQDAQRRAAPAPDVQETDCWYLGYTSGTTGRPKAVIVNHRSRALSVLLAAAEFRVSEDDRTLLTMPLFHSNGIFFLLMLLHVGGTAHIAEEFDAEAVLRAIDAHGITLVSMVPTMYALILALPQATKARYRIGSLRVTISSSAPLLAKTKEEMLSFFPGASIYEFYGSSEASFVTCLKPKDQSRKLRSVGRPFLGTEVRLLDDEHRPVAVGEVGELWSRSPMQTFDGYADDAEANAAAFLPGGWFSAGDMAQADEEGFLYIVDRKKDLIISGGENVYPTEVEDLLCRHPAIEEVGVIGMPHEVWGEQVCAVVRLRPGCSLQLGELRQWAKSQMADFKCPRALEVWPELPKGPTGKLLRRQIRSRLAQA